MSIRRYTGHVTREGVRHNTFLLLWCEDCSKAEEPPLLPPMGIVGQCRLTCAECSEELTLIEAFVMGTHVHDAPGAAHKTVATLGNLGGRP